MIVSVILNTEYMTTEERIKWFLKSVSLAKNEDCIIVTHECIKKQLEQLVNGCQERFYREFEMMYVSVGDIMKMDICYLPDAIFDGIYSAKKNRTKSILELLEEEQPELEGIITSFIDECLEKRKIDKPDFILNSIHTPCCLINVSRYYNVPIIPYVFSCIRKVHGYQMTLYMAHISDELFCSNECKNLYDSYSPELFDFDLLSKKEILSLLGKNHNLFLLPLIENEGITDFGVCGEGFHIVPNTFIREKVTDDDLYFEIKRVMPEANVVSRMHPIQMDQSGFGRKHMKNDPVSFILGCKKIVTVQSQMIVKALMWNRTACVLGDALPYSFLLENEFGSEKKISDEDLNFLLFGYFVPNSCMFNRDYWKWRMTRPSANELVEYHLKVIFEEMGIGKENILNNNRIELILKNRGISDSEIRKIVGKYKSKEINYNYLLSKATLVGDDEKDLYSLNNFEGDLIISCFTVENVHSYDCIKINLPYDLDAFIKIESIKLDGKKIECDTNQNYWKKCEYKLTIPLDVDLKEVKIVWKAKSFFDAFE